MTADDKGNDVNVAPNSSAHEGSQVAVIDRSDEIADPGLPKHHERLTDKDERLKRRASRQVAILFGLSMLGSVLAIVAYFVFPIHVEDLDSVRHNTMFIGIGLTLALFGLGIGAVHWAKQVMVDHEGIDYRHPQGSSDETKARAAQIMREAGEESGLTGPNRRTIIRNSLIGALIALPLPGIVLFRDLYNGNNPDPVEALSHTMWKKGTRLVRDPSGTPIKASQVQLGAAYHVIPEGLNQLEKGKLDEKAKAVVLLMRLPQEDLHELPERKGWSYDGIVAYSKICTHVGCPVALYEQQTHHLLCPCHQSQFDVTNHCAVIFGPAARPLPQLPITVDDEGYLIAQSDFLEPVGPSFWERRGDYLDN